MRILREATERGWMDFDPREIDVVAHALPGMVAGHAARGETNSDDPANVRDYLASASKIGRSGVARAQGRRRSANG